MCWTVSGRRRRRKVFFFEKKKQKTFALALLPPDASLPDLARNLRSKSFLLLFFKKEVLSSLMPKITRIPHIGLLRGIVEALGYTGAVAGGSFRRRRVPTACRAVGRTRLGTRSFRAG
jgi:hypothetical protein